MTWKGTSPNRTRGRAWTRIRAQVLAEEPICRICIDLGEVGPDSGSTICDHILSLGEGGTDDRKNLQGLCKTHSDEKTAAEAARKLGRPAPRVKAAIDADGWPRQPRPGAAMPSTAPHATILRQQR